MTSFETRFEGNGLLRLWLAIYLVKVSLIVDGRSAADMIAHAKTVNRGSSFKELGNSLGRDAATDKNLHMFETG